MIDYSLYAITVVDNYTTCVCVCVCVCVRACCEIMEFRSGIEGGGDYYLRPRIQVLKDAPYGLAS